MTRRNPLRIIQTLVLLLAILLAVPAARPAHAQTATGDEVTIQRLRVQIMPEFDDPRVLVIVQGRLTADEDSFPRTATFRLPAAAQINQMAGIDMSTGQTAAQEYTLAPDPASPEWNLVTYSLPSAHFFYEYYYDPLPTQDHKEFTFDLKSLQAIDDLVIEIQEPLKATDFALQPAAASTRLDESFGLTYHQLELGSQASGANLSILIQYTKTDPNPSVSREQFAADTGVAETAAPIAATTESIPPWVLIVVGVIVLFTTASIIWNRARPEPAAATVPAAAHCTQCGVILKPNARFCHVCGTVQQPAPPMKQQTMMQDGHVDP